MKHLEIMLDLPLPGLLQQGYFWEDHAFGGHACSARGILIGQQRVQSKIQAGNIVQQVIVPLLNQPQGT